MPNSELLEKPDLTPRPDYSEDEREYVSALHKKLKEARDQRDQTYDEWDGMDYITHYEANEKAANTFIPPKKNREDTNFQSGTIRQKVFALLSALVNLNLSPDIETYDKEGLRIQALGNAMEDIFDKSAELDGDEEKKYLRHYELLKQGTVFVEEVWDEKRKKVKKMKGKFKGKLKVDWDEKVEKAFAHPSRNVIPGPNVYLGDMTKYDISDQPFIFTVDIKSYSEAKMIFGDWDRWQNVPRQLQKLDPQEKETVLSPNWRLLEMRENFVEIVRYQDKWNNEIAVLCNGVLMTPIGLPLPYGFDEYTIAQQNLEPIHIKFAYGKSLVSRIRNKTALLDELLRLGVLKTQKSFIPPYLNLSGRILSSRVLMPGKISHGIPANSLIPINDKETQGVSNAELAMIKEIQESINSETTSPTFSGQQAKGSPTATEIIELQRQAKMVLGLTIFAVSTLEWKLSWLRLKNILNNWFSREDTMVDEVRGEIKSRYRNISVSKQIEGGGMGRRIIIPTKEIPSSEAIKESEDILSEQQGMPVRLIFLNPDEVNSAKLTWQISIRAKEKKSSEIEKLLFRAEMQDAMMFGPLLNMDYLSERFATVWNEDYQKLFKKQEAVPATQMMQTQGAQGAQLSPERLPTAESALGGQVRAGLGMTQ